MGRVIARCSRCGADLGPWEDRHGCSKCHGLPGYTIAEWALRLLEESEQPLAYWDIGRLLRASGREVWEPSLKATLGTDRRFCWAGRGIYGLFRHGFLPGVRDLARVGGIYLHAADRRLAFTELDFVLKFAGYRYQELSLRNALWREVGSVFIGTNQSTPGAARVITTPNVRRHEQWASSAVSSLERSSTGSLLKSTLGSASGGVGWRALMGQARAGYEMKAGGPQPDAAISARMRRTRQRDTAAELALRRELYRRGLRYFVDFPPLKADRRRRADVVFPRARVAIYVDGCFWHGCPLHATWPKTNAQWWRQKIERNRARDRSTDEALRDAGWTVVRVWEHEDAEVAADRVQGAVHRVIAPSKNLATRSKVGPCPK